MSNQNESTKKLPVRILIVALPVVVFTAAYFLLFNDGSPNNSDVTADSLAPKKGLLLEPESQEKKLSSKSEIYDNERYSKASKELMKKRSTLDDIFAEAEDHSKKIVPLDEETKENWDVEKKQKSTAIDPLEILPEEKPVEKRIASSPPKKQKIRENSSSNVQAEKREVQSATNSSSKEQPQRRTFYSSSGNESGSIQTNNASKAADTEGQIECIVDAEHIVRSGQTVRIRALQSFVVNGITIPKGTVFSGIASLTQERINVKVSSIKLPNTIVPCRFDVYGYDGVLGIYSPGGVNQEIAKNTTKQSTKYTANIPVVGSLTVGGADKKIDDPSARIPIGSKIYLMRSGL